MELKGSKTEKNLMTLLQENHKQEINIHILQVRLEKTDLNKLQQFLKKQLTTKKNMQKYGSNY